MANKLLFQLDINFGEKIKLVANNHKDLEDYLRENYDWYKITVYDDYVRIIERQGYESEVASLEWIKEI